MSARQATPGDPEWQYCTYQIIMLLANALIITFAVQQQHRLSSSNGS